MNIVVLILWWILDDGVPNPTFYFSIPSCPVTTLPVMVRLVALLQMVYACTLLIYDSYRYYRGDSLRNLPKAHPKLPAVWEAW